MLDARAGGIAAAGFTIRSKPRRRSSGLAPSAAGRRGARGGLYAHRVTLLDGGELDLASLRGRPTLIVNTASKCGFTPQYAGLQRPHERYASRGLALLGSPSADFAGQEYDEAAQIGAFFTKYLVGSDGRLVMRFPTRTAPEDVRLVAAIEAALPDQPASGSGGGALR
ncbi:MAG: glutathione peroxidase [Solirubrobacteraceae bacterium]